MLRPRLTPPILFHPRMLAYDFGPSHPLRPERMAMCAELLDRYGVEFEDPGSANLDDAKRVHSEEYLTALLEGDRLASGQVDSVDQAALARHGFLLSDNPPFAGMHQASFDFAGASVEGARRVRDGASRALTFVGGLHHASRDRASGFCLISDPSIAISILLERFERVAYVDIDLHHGDGVQAIWLDDPRVLTCSIHQDGRTLFPGTGFVHETGAAFTSLNVPLAPYTTGDVWLEAFDRTILPAIDVFQPDAIVLQMGSDAHFSDPLGHLQVAAQDWLAAVDSISKLELPLVTCGGGGYRVASVARMWAAAMLTLADIEFDDRLPQDLAERWGTQTFSDPNPPGPANTGRKEAEEAMDWLNQNLIPRIPRP